MQRGRRVLIVDDDGAMRTLLRILLEREQCDVHEAVNGDAAIDEASVWHPEVIVLDLDMPVMDGREAIPHLRRVAPEAPIVVLSARHRAADDDLGADAFVAKGADLETVIDLVDRATVHT